ncbi:MAG: permease, partial [Gammaproteobacteria bacterium]
TALPADFFQQLEWTQGISGMLIMLMIALPLYVCSTASVPIAASFVAAGMPTGTALVFLMAGPATNIATLGAVYRALGWRILAVYLGTVIVMSIGLGLGFDSIIQSQAVASHEHVHGEDWLGIIAALALIGLWLYLEGRRFMQRRSKTASAESADVDMKLKVEGMSCQHCVANVKKTLEGMDGVDEATPDLDSGWVAIRGDALNAEAMSEAIHAAGYQVVEK